jgi:DNA-binding transcriptional LysR family regulator
MELRQLEYFVAVARHGTYVAAAAASSVAQPALWRQVKELERDLGTPLFEKVGRRVRLTREGEALADRAAAVLDAVGRLRGAADDIRAGRVGVVAIACAAPHLRGFLAPVIAALRAAQPGIDVRVREYGGGGRGPGAGMQADLQEGVADLATGVPANEPRTASIPLYRTRLVVAVPDDHPWRDRTSIGIEELRDRSLVVAQPGSYSRRALETAAARAGFSPVIGFDSPNPLSILALGAAGLGLPVLVEDAISPPSGQPWPALAEAGREIGETIRLGWRSGAPPSAAVAAFIELARDEAARRERPD